jgi:hypothetical protein
MRHVAGLVLLLFVSGNLSAAPSAPATHAAPRPVTSGDDDEPLFTDDDIDSGDIEDEELSLGEAELRGKFQFGAALSYGTTGIPWQTAGLTGYRCRGANWAGAVHLSYGKWGFGDNEDNKNYSMSLFSRTTAVSARYFFTDVIPVAFVQSTLGYGFWTAKVTPQSPSLKQDDDPAHAKLSTSYSGHGPLIGASLGLATLWENGFYFEYTFFGLGKTWLISDNSSQNTPEARKFFKSKVEQGLVWGITNVTLGYFF